MNDLGIISSPGFAEVDRAVFAGLQKSPYRIELYHESLELTLFPDEASQRQFREEFVRKYSNRKPDVIIAAGSGSFNFLAESHEDFLRNIPIVFCAILGEIPKRPNWDLHFTGILGRLHPQETLQAALQLLPGTKHVVVTGGVGKFDSGFEAITKQGFQDYESKLEFTYLTRLTMPVLLEQLERLPSNTIVFHTAITQDAAGERFIDSTQSVPLVIGAANAPVFVMDDVDLREGAVGGDLVNWADDGRVAAEMAVRVLNGERPEDIPVATSNVAYMFDWRALQHWGLKESNLPTGSIILNRPPSFWQIYKRYILAGIFVIFAQAMAILALLWQRAKRRKSEQDLMWRLQFESLVSYFSSTLINLREEEVDANIEKSMARLGKFLELDRISLFQFSKDKAEMSLIISWKNDDTAPAPAELDTRDLPWWREQVLRGKVSLMSDVDLLPSEAVREQEYLRQRGILSAASIPLSIGGQVNGAISLVSTKGRVSWKPDLVSQLQVIGEIFWNALQRKRALAMLRESEERFRLVANTAPVMIWMSGEDRLCNYVNEPWLEFTGRSFEQELGDGWTESVHAEDLLHCLVTYANAFDQRTAFQVEYRLKRHDGEYRWIFDYGVPRFNADGSFAGYIGSCTDITERKKAEEALSGVSRRLIEAQEQERTWIARELHDDVNQRIALLSASFGIFIRSIPELAARSKEKAEELRDSIIALGSDIQALSHRLHSSKLEYLGLASACSSFCKEISSRQNVQVHFQSDEIPKSLPEGIALCLFRVLQEALQNAVKHSGVSRFSVALRILPCCIELCVRDSGSGFNSESATDSHGLGLTSMKERLKLVDGQLLIESKPQGGTTICARVPMHTRAKTATPR